jgi:hypothetical protein
MAATVIPGVSEIILTAISWIFGVDHSRAGSTLNEFLVRTPAPPLARPLGWDTCVNEYPFMVKLESGIR